MIFWSTDIKWDHSGAGIYIDLFYDQTLARHFLGLLKAHEVQVLAAGLSIAVGRLDLRVRFGKIRFLLSYIQ